MSTSDKGPYDDIINLPRHVSPLRAKMSMRDRAGQFAPFAALTGYGEKIGEASRSTDGRVLLEEDAREELDRKFAALAAGAGSGAEAEITYFVRDEKKSGGSYRKKRGSVERVELSAGTLTLSTGETLSLGDISAIDCAMPDRHD